MYQSLDFYFRRPSTDYGSGPSKYREVQPRPRRKFVSELSGAKASWAKVSHVPAINALPGLRLAAVATRNEQSARAAAEAFGADRWFADPYAMIRDDLIDIVTIAVKVPAHRELVLAALDAGKAVYCEEPLGRNVPETEEMASAIVGRPGEPSEPTHWRLSPPTGLRD
jgi:Oxidoreductase family, NAD-binding Rossmann fold